MAEADTYVMSLQDFWAVYHDKLGFLKTVNENDIFIRTSTETRTFQVAGGLLAGMDPGMIGRPFPVTTQPAPVRTTLDNAPPDTPTRAPSLHSTDARTLVSSASRMLTET